MSLSLLLVVLDVCAPGKPSKGPPLTDPDSGSPSVSTTMFVLVSKPSVSVIKPVYYFTKPIKFPTFLFFVKGFDMFEGCYMSLVDPLYFCVFTAGEGPT